MLLIIVIILFVIVAGILLFAATRPSSFRIQRSISIDAPAEKIFPYINDLRRWSLWSPYDKIDPNMKKTISGPEYGKGAALEWDGNAMAGKGRMEIIDSIQPSQITFRLDLSKPLEGHNIAEFTLIPTGRSTHVTWMMYGPTAYIAKVLGIFVSMDTMIGKDFSAGLFNLKVLAEK